MQLGSAALEIVRSFVLPALVSVDAEDPLRILVIDSRDSCCFGDCLPLGNEALENLLPLLICDLRVVALRRRLGLPSESLDHG